MTRSSDCCRFCSRVATMLVRSYVGGVFRTCDSCVERVVHRTRVTPIDKHCTHHDAPCPSIAARLVRVVDQLHSDRVQYIGLCVPHALLEVELQDPIEYSVTIVAELNSKQGATK